MDTRGEMLLMCLAGLLVVHAAEAVMQQPAEALHLSAAPAASLGATADICNGRSQVCQDCSTQLACYRLGETYTPGRTTACPRATPYCEDGECVATLSEAGVSACARAVSSTTFVCPTGNNSEGYYPDASNCRRYHFCDASGNAYDFDCTPFANTIYNYETASCTPQSQATCTTFTCNTNNIGTYQTYRPDPTVYLVCVDTNVANARMAKCPSNMVIDATDPNNVVCRLTCLAAGRLAFTNDTTKYYDCVSLGGTTYSSPMPAACPGNSTFSVLAQRCLFADASDCSSQACLTDPTGCGCG